MKVDFEKCFRNCVRFIHLSMKKQVNMSSIKDSFDGKKEELSKDLAETTDSFKKTMNSGVQKTKNLLRKLLWFSFFGLILFGIGYYLWANYEYSDGSRTGYLIKISEKGYVFKTNEGQMNLGGFQTGTDANVIGNIWDFSIIDDKLYIRLEELEGKKVTLRYKEHNKALFWQGDTNYFVYAVEER